MPALADSRRGSLHVPRRASPDGYTSGNCSNDGKLPDMTNAAPAFSHQRWSTNHWGDGAKWWCKPDHWWWLGLCAELACYSRSGRRRLIPAPVRSRSMLVEWSDCKRSAGHAGACATGVLPRPRRTSPGRPRLQSPPRGDGLCGRRGAAHHVVQPRWTAGRLLSRNVDLNVPSEGLGGCCWATGCSPARTPRGLSARAGHDRAALDTAAAGDPGFALERREPCANTTTCAAPVDRGR